MTYRVECYTSRGFVKRSVERSLEEAFGAAVFWVRLHQGRETAANVDIRAAQDARPIATVSWSDYAHASQINIEFHDEADEVSP